MGSLHNGKDDISLPDWIENGATLSPGQDLLGLRNPIQQISNSLLIGITTVTPNIRYLTFRSWIVHKYVQLGLPADKRTFDEFAARMECAIVLANLLNNKNFIGLVGSDKAADLVQKHKQILPPKAPSHSLGVFRFNPF